MHGVDTADQYPAFYPFICTTVKWPKKVFFYLSSSSKRLPHTISHAETLLKVCSKFQVFITYSFRVIIFFTEIMKEGYVDTLSLSLLMSYIYGATSNARNLTSYIYIYGRDFLLGILLLEPCILLIYA
jgi:hypothetical protein